MSKKDEQEQQVLALIAEDPKISLKKLSVELGTSLYLVKMSVQRLKEKRRLCFEGRTRGGVSSYASLYILSFNH